MNYIPKKGCLFKLRSDILNKFSFENIRFLIPVVYLLVINIIAVCVTVSDKKKAQHHQWRVKESALLLIALFGGSVGMFLTMKIIRHKTQKKKFMIGIPVIFILQTAFIFLAIYWGKLL